MVRLTKAGEYAIRGMVFLASQPSDRLVQLGDIARGQQVSTTFLAKVFQSLSRKGLVESRRGSGGGVSLSRPAREINLRMIVEAVEGPMALNDCLLGEGTCSRAGQCRVADVWKRAQANLLSVLESSTLAQLAQGDGGVQ